MSLGTAALLQLPDKGRVGSGHVRLLPIEHVGATRAAEEHTWEELRNFKKCLIRMYAELGKEAVFVETAMRLKDPKSGTCDLRTHAVVECFALNSGG